MLRLAKLTVPAIGKLHMIPAAMFASKKIPLPFLADSIKDVTVLKYLVKEGDFVKQDDEVLEVESHKGSTKIRTDTAGKVTKLLLEAEAEVAIGTPYIEVDADAKDGETKAAKSDASADNQQAKKTPKQQPDAEDEDAKSKSKPKAVEPPAKKEQKVVEPAVKKQQVESTSDAKSKDAQATKKDTKQAGYVRTETKEKMSRLRKTVAERLKESQNTNAQVTTMQEIDMSEIMRIRKDLGEDFVNRHGVKLGFMSFFVKAVTRALQERPIVNSVIQGNEIIHRNYIDISVAVSSPKGLVVPVLRDCELLSFADVEKSLSDLAKKASNGQLAIEDMTGGTFTISNGGIFGSMLSIPIINPPQTAVLGMHNIVNRPVVRGDQIVARPIMYVSMSYDHRLLDGREGASFLKRVSELLEDPRKLMLEF